MFGTLVRSHRLERSMSLRSLARSLDISPTYLSRVERNENPPLTEARCRDLARALELDPDTLITLAGHVPSDIADAVKRDPAAARAALKI